MEIKKLKFENHIWNCMNKGSIICIYKNEDCSFSLSYEKNNRKLECQITGDRIQKLLNKLNILSIHTWENEYHEPILDGEIWEINIVFDNNEEKTIKGFNGYPKNWKQFLYLYFWVAQCCEENIEANLSTSKNTNDLTDFDVWELDRKFELLDAETLACFTGTGTGLRRK